MRICTGPEFGDGTYSIAGYIIVLLNCSLLLQQIKVKSKFQSQFIIKLPTISFMKLGSYHLRHSNRLKAFLIICSNYFEIRNCFDERMKMENEKFLIYLPFSCIGAAIIQSRKITLIKNIVNFSILADLYISLGSLKLK